MDSHDPALTHLNAEQLKYLASDEEFGHYADAFHYVYGGRAHGRTAKLKKTIRPFVVETTLKLKLNLWQRLLLLFGRSGSVVTKLSVDNLRAVMGLESIVTVDQSIQVGKIQTTGRKIISK